MQIIDLNKLIAELNESIPLWLDTVNRGQGIFTHCREGNLYSYSSKTGLGSASLALKIHHQMKIVPPDDLIQRVLSFKNKDNWFEDRIFNNKRKTSSSNVIVRVLKPVSRDYDILRAETRQALAALMPFVEINWSLPGEIKCDNRFIEKFLSRQQWELNPWAAGSHTSHLVFFYTVAGKTESQNIVFKFLESIQDRDTGTWFLKRVDSSLLINGAMKVCTAYNIAERNVPFPEKLIDFCLGESNLSDACHNLNILYVIFSCKKGLGSQYREDEIHDFVEKRISHVTSFIRDDGAFSFHDKKSLDDYYGVKLCEGYGESDLSGTHLFVWLLTIADMIMNEKASWNLPVT